MIEIIQEMKEGGGGGRRKFKMTERNQEVDRRRKEVRSRAEGESAGKKKKFGKIETRSDGGKREGERERDGIQGVFVSGRHFLSRGGGLKGNNGEKDGGMGGVGELERRRKRTKKTQEGGSG